MRKVPYLIYPGDPTRMQVLWQLDTTAISTVEWGPDSTCAAGRIASAEFGDDHQHTATLTGLAPGRRCCYRVTTAGVTHVGAFTAAPDSLARRVKFLAYGDTRSDPASQERVATAMAALCAADPAYHTLALFMGDFAARGDDENLWTTEFFSPSQPHLRALEAGLPLQACIGNHDFTRPTLFTKYFPYPWVHDCYWSFDYGPVHVAVLDQYVPFGPASRQFAWLAADLAATRRPWKIVLLHEPGWSAFGGHDNDLRVQAYVEPLCERYGVALVLGGHNHYYARAMVHGIAHVTTGGGGAPLYTPELSAPNVVTAASAHHFCAIEIDGAVLRLRALTPAGALLDSFSLTRPGVR